MNKTQKVLLSGADILVIGARGEMMVDIQYAQILKLIQLSHSLTCTQILTALRFYCYYPYLTNEKTETQRE